MYLHQPTAMYPPQKVLRAIEAHALEGYPLEVCGAWSQRADGLWQVHRWTNTAPPAQAHRRFVVSPVEVLSLMQAEDRQELSLRGFYHSHPDAFPALSADDRQQLIHAQQPLYPEQDILIVGVTSGSQISWGLYRWIPHPPLAHDTKPR